MYTTYLDVLFVIFLCFLICVVICVLSIILSDNNLYIDKTSGYECGFDPFSDARDPFNIKFYLVSILFLVFDMEMIFFYPWILCQQYVQAFGFVTMYIFFIILVVGFSYEYRKKALD